jgi:hypothetical protein
MERVLEDIRRDTDAARLLPPHLPNSDPSNPQNPDPSPASLGSNKAGSTTTASTAGSSPDMQRKGGIGKANGMAMGKGKAGAGAGAVNGVMVNGIGVGSGSTGLAVPQTVIEEGIRITRECLEQVCEVDE